MGTGIEAEVGVGQHCFRTAQLIPDGRVVDLQPHLLEIDSVAVRQLEEEAGDEESNADCELGLGLRVPAAEVLELEVVKKHPSLAAELEVGPV
jgi:hypothetical protein